MALLFSQVTATAGNEKETFLVSGIPREFSDLEGWSSMEHFLMDVDFDTQIHIHADAYLYGDGEQFKATVEEVAYFMDRMRLDWDFLNRRCENAESVDFDFDWSPTELFGQYFAI